MKKVTYLMTILFAVALMSTSCCKDDPIVPDQTVAEQYPEWVNLTWVSTDGKDASYIPIEDTYPRLNITIVGDDITVNQPINSTQSYNGFYTTMTVSGADVSFGTPSNGVTGTFTKNGSQFILTTNGLSTTSHIYVLEPLN